MTRAPFSREKMYSKNVTWRIPLGKGRQVGYLTQTGFTAFGKGMHPISGHPYGETEQFSLLTSESVILANALT